MSTLRIVFNFYGKISQSQRPRPPYPPVTHTVCGPACRRLVRPHTCWPRSLKNQLHSTWPPRPHSLAGRPRMHSGGEGAHRPPWCARSLVRAVTKTLRRWRLRYSDPHSWLISRKFFEAPASTLLRGPQYRSGSARGCGPVSRPPPPKRGPSSLFWGALVAPASALLCGAQFWSGRWPALIFYPQHGYRSQQRQQWSGATNSGSASCTSP